MFLLPLISQLVSKIRLSLLAIAVIITNVSEYSIEYSVFGLMEKKTKKKQKKPSKKVLEAPLDWGKMVPAHYQSGDWGGVGVLGLFLSLETKTGKIPKSHMYGKEGGGGGYFQLFNWS